MATLIPRVERKQTIPKYCIQSLHISHLSLQREGGTISPKIIISMSVGSIANLYASLLFLYNKDSFISTSHSIFSIMPDAQNAFNKEEIVLLLPFCSRHYPRYCYYWSKNHSSYLQRVHHPFEFVIESYFHLWQCLLPKNSYLLFPMSLKCNDERKTISG